MMDPWFAAALLVGLVLSRRLAGRISPWRPFVLLGAFALAVIGMAGLIVVQELSLAADVWDLALSLFIGATFGVGAGLIDFRDEGYLVRGDEPEEEVVQ